MFAHQTISYFYVHNDFLGPLCRISGSDHYPHHKFYCNWESQIPWAIYELLLPPNFRMALSGQIVMREFGQDLKKKFGRYITD